MDLSQLTARELVVLAVVAILAATAGSLIALLLKEWLFTRWIEGRRARRLLEQAHRKYRDPMVLAALELCSRLVQICRDYPPEYLAAETLQDHPERSKPAPEGEPDLRRYGLESSVYRLCALLGWMELYRQEIVFMDTHDAPPGRQLDKAIYAIRSDLADSALNIAPDRDQWRDVVFFREEQRAIGEAMITTVSGNRVVTGYAEFCELLSPDNTAVRSRWIHDAASFLTDPREEKDFRLIRMQRLIVHLVDLVEILAPGRLRDGHREAREKHRSAALEIGDLTSTGIAMKRRN